MPNVPPANPERRSVQRSRANPRGHIMTAFTPLQPLGRRKPGVAAALGLLIGAAVFAAFPAPASAQQPGAATTSAGAAQQGLAKVNGVNISYMVHGDLASKQTPLMVLHRA